MTRWKLYHEIAGNMEIEYFLQTNKNAADIISAAYSILMFTNDQGKSVNYLPAPFAGSYTTGKKQNIEFSVIMMENTLQFYWRY